MAKSKTILLTEGLRKKFKGAEDFMVLKGIDLDIHSGEFVSIIGQSGSGKSTLLYIMSTLDTDYEGKFSFNGDEIKDLTKNQIAAVRNRDIGFVFQFHYLMPEFTVLENVSLPAFRLRRYKDDVIKKRALERLDLLGLADQAHKKANQLSGGQQQRVAIARALINDPKVIFGDEPTGNLDSHNAELVFETFKELSRKFHQTIVIVTHDNQIAHRTDRVITLKDGLILHETRPDVDGNQRWPMTESV